MIGIALKLVERYLSDRRQFVLFKDVKSEYATVTCGVPSQYWKMMVNSGPQRSGDGL